MKASVWMVGLSLVLFWIPFLGPLVAGFVGGRKAGAVVPGVVAVFLPSVIFAVLAFVLGGVLAGLPVIGWVFGLGGAVVSSLQIGPLLLGAVLGGATA